MSGWPLPPDTGTSLNVTGDGSPGHSKLEYRIQYTPCGQSLVPWEQLRVEHVLLDNYHCFYLFVRGLALTLGSVVIGFLVREHCCLTAPFIHIARPEGAVDGI